MMEVWAGVLLLYGAPRGFAMNSAARGLNGILPLDMAPQSVDDMYKGCDNSKQMKEYLQSEKNNNKIFKNAWDIAEKECKKKWEDKKKRWRPNALPKEQAIAIYIYTQDKPEIYPAFNEAVQTQKSEYQTTFRYHALHFYLTMALQALKNRNTQQGCITGYRRVNRYFSQDVDVINKEIRFGSFTSSSLDKWPKPEKFGDKSCFKIESCFGANISLYSKYGESEEELLIPPYEVFKVTRIQKRSENNNLPCEVVYEVKSTGTLSNLNCSLVQNKK
ncbi:erythroblast NAD(P)(+)--arginine ADP-ribosyltransferase-like [Anabas testudineus]|uniref:NAD(P)(+)--arginine ADP-ribosyltransferase n=1 Tax=Anabas testudineus TaxID=64144 RepID=A0A7N6BVC4_ANATE|nr:erythroblast NAD(P)(+)--arginine ADP-ribosyltransferase-like [Anabas testudineus]